MIVIIGTFGMQLAVYGFISPYTASCNPKRFPQCFTLQITILPAVRKHVLIGYYDVLRNL